MFLSDSFNLVVRRVDETTGIISTIAGVGSITRITNGVPALEASLDEPEGLTFDSFGNLFVAEGGRALIRRIDALTGNISTVAGEYVCDYNGCQGQQGYTGDGGPATSAKICAGSAAVDHLGNLYLSDQCNDAIRKIDSSTGYISTLAGNPQFGDNGEYGRAGYTGDGGPAFGAELSSPGDVTIDSSGNLLFADFSNQVIRKVTLPPTLATAQPVISLASGVYAPSQAITLTDSTPGSSIYYTTDGTLPSITSSKYAQGIQIKQSTVLTAFAVSPNLANSLGSRSIYTVLSAPTISPNAGNFNGPLLVSLSTTVPGFASTLYGNSILYTTDGSSPAINGHTYKDAFAIDATATINAVLSATTINGMVTGPVATATFTIKPQVAPPSFTPAVGSYPNGLSITLADATPASGIFYTTNGVAPTTSSTRYIKPVPITATTNFRAVAVATGDTPSPVVSGKFTIQALPIPTTSAASAVTSSTATLQGIVNPEGAAADYWFVYGLSATTLTSQTPIHDLIAGAAAAPVSAPLLDLTTKTKYFCQLVTANASGTATGTVLSFTTQ